MKTSHEPASELLDLVRTLFAELHRQTGHDRHITLDSSLDHELGFDSLARVELILRIQRAFGVDLPEDTLGRADTPRDLLQALHKGHAERIRLCGIDCPEKGQASRLRVGLWEGGPLQTHDHDKYKRTIRDVLLSHGINLIQELVKQRW